MYEQHGLVNANLDWFRLLKSVCNVGLMTAERISPAAISSSKELEPPTNITYLAAFPCFNGTNLAHGLGSPVQALAVYAANLATFAKTGKYEQGHFSALLPFR